jgi:hypothetical protein
MVQESTPSRCSHYRALVYLRHKSAGIINIESDYCFNLQDLTGRRSGDLPHYLRTEVTYREAGLKQISELNRYYHITCLEHILGPQGLLGPRHIVMEEQLYTTGRGRWSRGRLVSTRWLKTGSPTVAIPLTSRSIISEAKRVQARSGNTPTAS